ncbi:hypothetical protein AVEN_36458-1 [Araneus ventricosus]|uniref:Uncharacterized protein n=1 Tax=Araneus ventricosus TaxID=182803 RepID=A0A4Y2QWK6_ARAVE|nr:hypothetical protein AVEN_36458-1 [Araneus ventricosus]
MSLVVTTQSRTKDKKTESRRKPSRIGRRCGRTDEIGVRWFHLDVLESLEAQYFFDDIRDKDAQHSTRLMDSKDLKSSVVYSMPIIIRYCTIFLRRCPVF